VRSCQQRCKSRAIDLPTGTPKGSKIGITGYFIRTSYFCITGGLKKATGALLPAISRAEAAAAPDLIGYWANGTHAL